MADASEPNATTWQALRAWIDAKEASERMSGQPAITPTQVKMLLEAMSITEQPEMDANRNYVGVLNEFAQQNHREYALPSFSHEECTQLSGVGGSRQWRAFCTLPWCGEVFPQAGYGFDPGLQAPSFAVKKVAKQFAAKCALAFLKDQGGTEQSQSRWGTFLSDAEAPMSVTSGEKAGSSFLPPSTQQGAKATSPDPNLSVKRSESIPPNNGKGNTPDIQAMVRVLAAQLRYNAPLYNVIPEPGRPGFFQGVVVWPREPLRPDEPITVAGVYGESQATEQLAAKVFEWLSKELAVRQAEVDAVRSEMTGPPV